MMRSLKSILSLGVIYMVVACGNGASEWRGPGTSSSNTPDLGGISIPDFTMDITTSNPSPGAYLITNTNPNGWLALGIGNVAKLQIDVKFNNYFSINPNGHASIIMRQVEQLGLVRGAGVAMGNLSNAFEGTQIIPGDQIEAYAQGLQPPTARYLYEAGTTGIQNKLRDNVQYRYQVYSGVSQSNVRYTRYQRFAYVSAVQNYDLEVDTGWVQVDPANLIDYTQSWLLFATTFGSGSGGWSINFTGGILTYGPWEESGPDTSTKLSRFGDIMQGDLLFLGNRRVIAFDNPDANYDTWTRLSNLRPLASNLLITPGYDSVTEAGIMATNRRDTAGAMGLTSLRMLGSNALLETFAVNGAVTPAMDVKVGGQQVLQFNTSANMRLRGATFDVNSYTSRITKAYNWGGTEATYFVQQYPFDFDSLCTVGVLATLMDPTPTNHAVENAIRPLYCWFSCLLADIRDRGIVGYNYGPPA